MRPRASVGVSGRPEQGLGLQAISTFATRRWWVQIRLVSFGAKGNEIRSNDETSCFRQRCGSGETAFKPST